MPKFCVEQYELHTTTYYVEAPTAREAVQIVLNGEAEEHSSEFIEPDESRSAVKYSETGDDVDSIRSVEVQDEENPAKYNEIHTI